MDAGRHQRQVVKKDGIRAQRAEWLDGWRQDIVYSARSLRRTPGVTAAIGCGTFGAVSWEAADWDAPLQGWVTGPVGLAKSPSLRRLSTSLRPTRTSKNPLPS